MGRITPSFRQLYEEVMSDLRTELQGAFVDLGHKKAFDSLLKAWSQNRRLWEILPCQQCATNYL